MKLRDLKVMLESDSLRDDFLIFVCAEDTFIANMYIDAICEKKQLKKTVTDSIFVQDSALSLVLGFENDIRVIYTDVFDEYAQDYSRFTNTVVVCNKIDKKLTKLVADYVIDIPKLVEWQIVSYIEQQLSECCKIHENTAPELLGLTGSDIYRVQNEIDKLLLFEANEQPEILCDLLTSPDAANNNINAFDLETAILNNDKSLLTKFFRNRAMNNIALLSLTGMLLSKIKKTLLITYGNITAAEAAELGVSEKQYYYLRRNPVAMSQTQLAEKLEVLSGIDLMLKSGLLDISSEAQVDYLIMRVVS